MQKNIIEIKKIQKIQSLIKSIIYYWLVLSTYEKSKNIFRKIILLGKKNKMKENYQNQM
jgi:hypothetical protein